ncbi:hypothetical protein LTR05_000767 [Lithohypha guttulata]|uniref:D-xylose 1-dehydrogenase (NADP(+), D-xylono-1,5-lactone-forming) n=1 Tax=Lithohypha guttulata TaxID=1690604 RepID=A0AAN7T6H9_9EURO|nr:hypothetical protein LTR05_000767 [Lithohypha guttulata]
MALVVQGYTFLQQYAVSFVQNVPKKNQNALKMGVISTAQINAAAAIHPAETHPDVILYGIASRTLESAKTHAKKYKFQKAFGSYQELLDDTEVDFVYISTPNGQHYEWASKALKAGKHVLLEKPFTSNATEAKKLVEEADQAGKVLEEAFHWQFHPAAHKWRSIIDSGRYGQVIATDAKMTASPGVPHGDIRWQYDLAGGSAMDATYALNFTRYALRAKTPEKILSSVARPYNKDARVDAAMYTNALFKDGRNGNTVHSRIYTDLARSWVGGLIPRVWELPMIEVDCEKATIFFYNAMMPHLYHYIAVTGKATGKTEILKQYSGGPLWSNVQTTGGKGGSSLWSTYRYQMEAFVMKLKGKEPPCWVENEDSIQQMETIDEMYEMSGLGARLASKQR